MLGFISAFLSVLLVVLPVASAIRLIVKRKTTAGTWILWTAISAVGSYLVLISVAQVIQVRVEKNLARYDLDGDGGFSGGEITPEMEKAMEDFANDTGRSLAPLTGLFTCPLYSGFWHFSLGIPYLIISRRKQTKPGEHDGGLNGLQP
jgi:hypothetical protein